MSAKHKHDTMPLTNGEYHWLLQLYRWLKLYKTQRIVVAASPDECLTHLLRLDRQEDDKNRCYVRTNTSSALYQFEVEIWPVTNVSRYDASTGEVYGVILPRDINQTTSLITLRSYPDFWSILSSIVLCLVLCFCGLQALPPHNEMTTARIFFCLMVWVGFCLIGYAWYVFMRIDYQKPLTYLANDFTRLTPGSTPEKEDPVL